MRLLHISARLRTVPLFGHDLALPDLPVRLNLAGRRVAQHPCMDGRLAVTYKGEVLGLLKPAQLGPLHLEDFVPAPQYLTQHQPLVAAPTAPPTNGSDATSPRVPRKPDYNHPWRRQGRASYRCRQQQLEQQEQQ